MTNSILDYLKFCELFAGGIFLSDREALTKTIYWSAVFLTLVLTILFIVVFSEAFCYGTDQRAMQLFLAITALSTILFGLEVPFLVTLLSFGGTILFGRN